MLAISVLSPAHQTEIQASTKSIKNVTKSVSGKKKIQALARCFETPCGYDLIYKMKVGKTKKYDFSKASARRYITNMCSSYFPKISANTVSKRLFGKSTSKLEAFVGDWGMAWPEIKIKKIYRLSTGTYRVDAHVLWHVQDVRRYTVGTLKIYLRKKSHSHYGYIATSMTIKKVANR